MARSPNPRPRKYASAAERQAAYRNRWATIEIRVTPEQAETIQSIADERDISRNELAFAMLQFALTNHNWRNPTYSARLPRLADLEPTGDYFVQTEFNRERGLWVAVLRDAQLNIVAKPRESVKRPGKLTWEDFEAFDTGAK